MSNVFNSFFEKYDKGFLDLLKKYDTTNLTNELSKLGNFQLDLKGTTPTAITTFANKIPGTGILSRLITRFKAFATGKNKIFLWLGVVLIIIAIILRRRHNNEKGKTYVLTYPMNAQDEYQISARETTLITEGLGISTTINMWFKVDDWNYRYNEDKYLVIREGLYIYLAPQSPDLTIQINTFAPVDTVQTLRVKNIALQKWNNLALTLDGRTVDIWINGELRLSATLKHLPKIADSGQMVMCAYGGYIGQIGQMFISERAMTRREIERMWRKGPRRTGRARLHNPALRIITQTKTSSTK